MLRAGSTAAVLSHRVMAPSTLGTFLRAFTFGHVRQLEAVIGRVLERAWTAGAGPGDGPLVIDVDSTICPVDGNAKQGAGFGYTKVLGYHPILATRADTGEVLHARMRKGSGQHPARRPPLPRRADRPRPSRRRHRPAHGAGRLRVLVQRHHHHLEPARRALHDGRALRRHDRGRGDRRHPDEDAWVDIAYPDGGQAQVADTTYTTGTGRRQVTRRLVVRRTRLTDSAQQRLWPDWRHHAFLTDLTGDAVTVDAFHRHHAVVELAIRDLKDGAGLDHVPSGNFHANSAWLQCAVLAHNLIRWTAMLGDVRVDDRADRRPHHPHPTHQPPRPARQPRRATNAAPARTLAVGEHLHHRARLAPPAATRPRLNVSSRSGAPHSHRQR